MRPSHRHPLSQQAQPGGQHEQHPSRVFSSSFSLRSMSTMPVSTASSVAVSVWVSNRKAASSPSLLSGRTEGLQHGFSHCIEHGAAAARFLLTMARLRAPGAFSMKAAAGSTSPSSMSNAVHMVRGFLFVSVFGVRDHDDSGVRDRAWRCVGAGVP